MTVFEQHRADYSLYGLKCELWTPTIMPRFDHHNEIEINFAPRGTLSYFFHNRIINLPEGAVCLFWGFMSHRIVSFRDVTHYYVVTIPIDSFLKWNLSEEFTRRLFSGEIIADLSCSAPDNLNMFNRWLEDSDNGISAKCIELELHARLLRMDAARNSVALSAANDISAVSPINKIHEIILYISHNYSRPIRTAEIARAVGLNPDYAGALFKKVLGTTISEYLTKERIACAQRALLFSTESITEIAYSSGFGSISSFNIAFRRVTAQTPRDYRRKNTKPI